MQNKFLCKECTITFTSEIPYKKHLSSKTHFETINYIKIDKMFILKIRLYETPRNFVEYSGD